MSWKIDRSEVKAPELVTTAELTTRAAQRRAAVVNLVRRLAIALRKKLSWL